MKGYVFYALGVLAIFVFWLLVFLVMRGLKERRGHNIAGGLLAGPIHFYLAKRRYSLNRRELFGWLAVLLLMLLAPLVTHMLEGI